jgi:PKHD-type hydroxylase
MLLQLPDILSAGQVADCRAELDGAEWTDGRITAGHQAAHVKRNSQVPQRHPIALKLGEMIVGTLERSPAFLSAALPLKVFPPMFNRYAEGEGFGTHIDTAIRQVPGTPHRVRTDLSATLFLSEPDDYSGGELIVEDTFGAHAVKLPAGSMVLYPAGSLHHVAAVTSGQRVAAVFWIQSMVRDDGQRALLYDLDTAIQQLTPDGTPDPALVRLTGVYHNLLRQWADA